MLKVLCDLCWANRKNHHLGQSKCEIRNSSNNSELEMIKTYSSSLIIPRDIESERATDAGSKMHMGQANFSLFEY